MSVPPPPSHTALLEHVEWARRLALAMSGDPHLAEDVVQEAMRIGIERPPERLGQIKAWLAQVIRNRINLHYRGSTRRVRRERKVAREDACHDHPLDLMEREEAIDSISETLLGLPEPYQQSLLMRYWDGLPIRDIGEALGVPERTVESRLRKGRQMMRDRLDARHKQKGAWATVILPLLRPTVPVAPAATVGAGAIALATIGVLATAGCLYLLLHTDPGPEGGGSPTEAHASRATAAGDSSGDLTPDGGTRTLLVPEDQPGAPPEVIQSARFRFVDAETGEAVGGMRATLQHLGPAQAKNGNPPPSVGFLYGKNRPFGVYARELATSGPDGRMEALLHPGATRVQAGPSHFHPEYGLLEPERHAVHRALPGGEEVQIQVLRKLGSVRGRVVPIGAVESMPSVSLRYFLGKPKWGGSHPADHRFSADASGAWSMAGVITRESGCTIRAEAEGWYSPFLLRLWKNGGPDFDDVVIPIVPARPVTVTVLGPSGEPIPDARVSLILTELPSEPNPTEGTGYEANELADILSDTRGVARWKAVPAHARIQVRAEGFRFTEAELEDDQEEILIHLARGVQIDGRVTDLQGHPLADAEVELLSEEELPAVKTGPDGLFRFEDVLADQTARFRVHRPGYAHFLSEQLSPSAMGFQRLALQPGLAISGRVASVAEDSLRTGRALSIEVLELDRGPRWDDPESPPVMNLDEDGGFVVPDLPAGLYLLRYRTAGAGEVWAATARAGETGVVIGPETDPRLFRVHGRVYLEEDPSAPSRVHIRIYRVPPRPSDRRPAPWRMLGEQIQVGVRGEFRLHDLPPGHYMVCFWDPQRDRLWFEPLELPQDAGPRLEVAMPLLRDLELRLLGADGQPLDGARVELMDARGSAHPFTTPARGEFLNAVLSEEDGRARLTRVPRGRGMSLRVRAEEKSPWRVFPVDELTTDGEGRVVLELD